MQPSATMPSQTGCPNSWDQRSKAYVVGMLHHLGEILGVPADEVGAVCGHANFDVDVAGRATATTGNTISYSVKADALKM